MQKKILFFDDEEFTTNSLIRNLRNNYNLDITFVSTISNFFEELNNNDYALIIMDVMAPPLIPQKNEKTVSFTDKELAKMRDGIQTGEVLTNKIRESRDKKYKDIPILFLTARPPFSLPDGVVAYLRKPELAAKIFSEIKNLLNEQ